MKAQGAIECCFGSTARPLVGQWAIESSDASLDCRHLAGQGATEYLVLLAVVLIVALVSVALLGFFPGMASDAQITQSQMYWKSANPISIVENGARVSSFSGNVYPYLRIRNSGIYPIRIIAIIGGDGGRATQFYGGASVSCGTPTSNSYNLSDYYYMAPGEEKYIAPGSSYFGLPCYKYVTSLVGGTSSGINVAGASSVCQNSSSSPGTLSYKTFGFEYIEYIDGQQITKRQIGKDLIIKCMPPF